MNSAAIKINLGHQNQLGYESIHTQYHVTSNWMWCAFRHACKVSCIYIEQLYKLLYNICCSSVHITGAQLTFDC